METFGRAKTRVRRKSQRIPGQRKTSAPAKTDRSQPRSGQTTPAAHPKDADRILPQCRDIWEGKIRVRVKPQWIWERRERVKTVETCRPRLIVLGNCSTAGWRCRIPAETYCSRLLREQISPTTHPSGMCRTLAQNSDISEGKCKNWRKTRMD